MKSLEQVIADWRERASGCRRVHDDRVGGLIDELCDEVATATEDYRKWLSETDAMIRCGRTRYWLRSRFADWARADLARWSPRNKRAREYRAMVVPQRTDVNALRDDARRAARGEEDAA